MRLSTLHVVFALLSSATAAVVKGDRDSYVDVETLTSYPCALNCYRNMRCHLNREKLYDLCRGEQAKRIQKCIDEIVLPCVQSMCLPEDIPEIILEHRDYYDSFCSFYPPDG